eukprot:CAMPEP_0196189038 /NCGR_PEP_ID=MMETSP0911-20130528/43463_1 /TAXON_ID=49265 /ORGANISM="Thalassiosira rotula, Strain GSO102" /LENGTH=58 /DNA_ID=CAMNT_0041460537 /DNA_START=87 /DNA_END=258 /DNA_ORIENTATION=+
MASAVVRKSRSNNGVPHQASNDMRADYGFGFRGGGFGVAGEEDCHCAEGRAEAGDGSV